MFKRPSDSTSPALVCGAHQPVAAEQSIADMKTRQPVNLVKGAKDQDVSSIAYQRDWERDTNSGVYSR